MSSEIFQNRDNKSTVYVGNLAAQVTEDILYAAFMPFGEIVDIFIPKDFGSHDQHRGFGFVEFELIADAHAAIDNMHLGQLEERTIKCSIAKKSKSFYEAESSEIPVWEQEAWLEAYANLDEQVAPENGQELKKPRPN